jgi:hypothetical protein
MKRTRQSAQMKRAEPIRFLILDFREESEKWRVGGEARGVSFGVGIALEGALSVGLRQSRVSGRKKPTIIAEVWRQRPRVRASQGFLAIKAAARGGAIRKQAMLAPPRKKNVDAISEVGVTSETVVKIRAVATMEPPPARQRMEESQRVHMGNMLGNDTGSR